MGVELDGERVCRCCISNFVRERYWLLIDNQDLITNVLAEAMHYASL